MRSVIIGNGESRRTYNLQNITDTTFGSNAICRDHEVDYLVCCDKRMVEEVLSINYPGKIFTRRDWYHRYPENRVFPLPEFSWEEKEKWQQSFHWGSGLHSVHLAIKLGYTELELVGFDLWGKDGKQNNIYSGTENYGSVDSSSVDPSFWISQFVLLYEQYPEVDYKFFNTQNWKIPQDWKMYSNFRLTPF